jgi:hypothetical protein
MERLILITAILAGAAVPASAGPGMKGSVVAPPGVRGMTMPMDGQRCQRFDVHRANPGETLRPKKLDELPPASLYLSVMRGSSGCYEPVIVRQGIGAAADEPSRPTARR